jgi:hypothetical protein
MAAARHAGHHCVMTHEPTEPEKKLDSDLEAFDKLPAKTHDLQQLQGLAEKTTGKERAVVDKEIQNQAQTKP